MTGLYLILIGLVIIYLTTPENRRKIARIYHNAIPVLTSWSNNIIHTLNFIFRIKPRTRQRKSKINLTIHSNGLERDIIPHKENIPPIQEPYGLAPDQSIGPSGLTSIPDASGRDIPTKIHEQAPKCAGSSPYPMPQSAEKTTGLSTVIGSIMASAKAKGVAAAQSEVPLQESMQKQNYADDPAIKKIQALPLGISSPNPPHRENKVALADLLQQISNANTRSINQEAGPGLTLKITLPEISEISAQVKTNPETEPAKMNIADFIEIEEEDEPIDHEKLSFDLVTLVPNWPHRYIYSLSDLDHANESQKEFYYKFRDTFFQGKCLDVLGNTNYYFLLLFDLLEQYEKHKDIDRLEKYIDTLASAYPRTRGYGRRFLLEKMRAAAYTQGIERLERRIPVEDSYLSWDWKGRYKDKLNLGKREMDILSKIYLSGNNFVSIPFCGVELVKLYIAAVKSLEESYQLKGLKKSDEFHIVLDLVARKEYRYHLNSNNYNYQIKNGENGLHEYIAGYCEQQLRNRFRYKKLSGFGKQYNHPLVKEAFNEHIMVHIEESLPSLLANVAIPDEQTEKVLYTLHSTRWKTALILEEAYYHEIGKEAYIGQAEQLILLNNSNPSLENIFLELYKFFGSLDRQKSLEYFLRYIHQNMSAKKFVLKDISQAMGKKLFKDTDSHHRFLKIITAMVKKEKDLQHALADIDGFYQPLRKKITLDTLAIEKIQQDFSGTVGVLSAFLSDETDEPSAPVQAPHAPASLKEDIAEDKPGETKNTGQEPAYQIEISEIEQRLLSLFSEHALNLTDEQLSAYCGQHGASPSVLINNINESSYELLDDLLIEKNTEGYSINSEYYTQIEKI